MQKLVIEHILIKFTYNKPSHAQRTNKFNLKRFELDFLIAFIARCVVGEEVEKRRNRREFLVVLVVHFHSHFFLFLSCTFKQLLAVYFSICTSFTVHSHTPADKYVQTHTKIFRYYICRIYRVWTFFFFFSCFYSSLYFWCIRSHNFNMSHPRR